MAPVRNRKKRAPSRAQPPDVPPSPAGEKVEVTAEDIGGELISLLSEGLYKNPLDAFREYIQNSIDAGAQRVNIKFTGRSVFIRDDGHGMTLPQLKRARRVGVSDKSFLKEVGFRGIGIYSAFHLCDRMVIRTKVSETVDQHIAEFDFAAMRSVLNQARIQKRGPASLMDLLYNYVTFRSDTVNYHDQRTIVELHNISELYYGDISSSKAVEKYLLDTVPVDFETSFEHRDAINARIKHYLPEQRTIRLSLSFKNEPERQLFKKVPLGLQPPRFEEAKDSAGNLQAFIWGCRNNVPKKIPDEEHAGFIYKLKGFTIGKVGDLRKMFGTRSMLYPWWTGEVYVLNDKVIPTTARDAFEYNPSSYILAESVQSGLTPFRKDAQVFQLVTRAASKIERIEQDFVRLSSRAAGGILTPSEVYELTSAERDASAQAKRLGKNEAEAAAVRTRALTLHQQLKSLRRAVEQHRPVESTVEEDSKDVRQPRSVPVSDKVLPVATDPVSPAPLIAELFDGQDPDDPEEARGNFDILLECIDEVLDSDSEAYRELYDAIDLRLNEGLD